jgi:4-aminobutyrate aminotransferase/(S)-3-amino-2-methylpropionate transaminase
MTLTGMGEPYKQSFGPFAPEVYRAPYPYEYRGWSTERALDGLRTLFATTVAPDRVAAFVIECELGDGGFVPAPTEFMQELRRIADEHGILLVCDEIQTGFGRTGRMFAFEHSEISPDLVVVGKALAGGLPLSAVVGRSDVMEAPEPGGLGGTFAGHPIACAAGLAVLDILDEEGLVARSAQLGEIMRRELVAIQEAHPVVDDVRGLGTMIALELVSDPHTREPDAGLVDCVLAEARQRGLIVIRCGIHRNVVRLLPPLVVSDADVRLGLWRLSEAIVSAVEEART